MPKSNETSGATEAWPIKITVNGIPVVGEVEPRTLLIDFLRTDAQLNGPRIGCEEGACGACTVELNGKTIKSCLTLAIQANGESVTTNRGGRRKRHLGEGAKSIRRMSCSPMWLLHLWHDHERSRISRFGRIR